MLERPRQLIEQFSLAWLDLFLEAGATLGENPAGEKAQALARRWMELWERSTGGDPGIKAGSIKAWADLENWLPAVRQRLAAFNWDKLAVFIGEAIRSSL